MIASHTVKSHSDAVRFFEAKRAELLATAEQAAADAEAALLDDADDVELVEHYLGLARHSLAEVARIDALRR